MSKYPNAYYRVSVKAIIRDEADRVLMVKESSDDWTLPGGGVDHGEGLDRALARELFEELAVTKILSAEYFSTYSIYARGREAWFMWILYNVTIEMPERLLGEHARDVAFLDLKDMRDSGQRSELRVHQALAGLRVEDMRQLSD
ncbi:MAG TPA: NUDIX hydrolase [Candidatus Saccharimonadales bacterium]|nr:NUDIX hydrolase [Candidatus Saccharimonadales bacterium]